MDMGRQEQFNRNVVAAARELVATAGLSHIPLLDALRHLRGMHERLNEADWRAMYEGIPNQPPTKPKANRPRS